MIRTLNDAPVYSAPCPGIYQVQTPVLQPNIAGEPFIFTTKTSTVTVEPWHLPDSPWADRINWNRTVSPWRRKP